jgi:hypothetical protein
MRNYSELKIIISNCLSGGTGWTTIQSEMIKNLQDELSRIDGLEFKFVNSNTVRGEHNGFTLILGSVFYDLSAIQKQDQASSLLEYVRNAVNRIKGLTYSEIRIENTRNLTIFNRI